MLQHAYDGSLWLYDFSTQGTKLNQQGFVQTKYFHQLLPGSSIQFGHSIRTYTICHKAP